MDASFYPILPSEVFLCEMDCQLIRYKLPHTYSESERQIKVIYRFYELFLQKNELKLKKNIV